MSKTQFNGERRNFVRSSAHAIGILALDEFLGLGSSSALADNRDVSGSGRVSGEDSKLPWYRRTFRWGQTNINELDPTRYDVDWWRGQWRRTRTQGIIVNAGGITAYYPSKVPGHRRARFLGARDLFGELRQAAREEGIAVIARMDSSGADQEFYQTHPDWFAVAADGTPYRRDTALYVPCVNGPYFSQHLTAILREIASHYRPEGFADNAWSGLLGRDSICYCRNCARRFSKDTGHELPKRQDWTDQAYRAWIEWGYARRLEIWDANNRLTRESGGADCVWVGMNGSSPDGESLRDLRGICQRADLLLIDDQARDTATGFQRNAYSGKLLHGALGWDKVVAESMAMYQFTSEAFFRLSAKSAPETRLWTIEGFAGGLQPWWHYVGAYGEDRRYYSTPIGPCQWHAANEQYLVRRRPVANVGVIWS